MGILYRQTSPDHDHHRQPDVWPDLLDDEPVRDLADGHTRCGDGKNRVVIMAAHVEGLFETCYIRIGESGTICVKACVSDLNIEFGTAEPDAQAYPKS
jgi:hypothetical protein